MACLFRSLLLGLFCLLNLVLLQGTSIDEVLDKSATLVEELASQAVSNYQKTCESLPQCTPATCFRHACIPQSKDEFKALRCSSVKSDSGCSSTCRNVHVSTNRSYVRISPLASRDDELQTSMCAQKPLDQKLQQSWEVARQFTDGSIFFGGADGAFYVFPGRDYMDDRQCSQYDDRRRPWYINSLAVLKSVYVLMDTSSTMGGRVGTLSSASCLDVGKGIVTELLKTFTNGDQVAVSRFGGELIGTQVSVSLEKLETSAEQSEVKSLANAVSQVKPESSPKDLKKALLAALQFFNSTTSLKVLLVLTDGHFANNLNVTDMDTVLQQLNQESVVVFFYRIGYDATNDVKFQEMKKTLNMTFEAVTDASNPLWRIRSYFDYIAWLRLVSVNKSTIWVPLYSDAAGLGNITTGTYPAFDADRRLIGIAGLDLDTTGLVQELGRSVVQDEVSRRSPAPSQQPALPLPEKESNKSFDCPSNANLVPVCPRQDSLASVDIREFVCCGDSCSIKDDGGSPASTLSKPGVIAGISVGGIGLLAAVALGSFFICRKLKQTCEENPEVVTTPPPPEWFLKPRNSPRDSRML